MSSFKFVRVYLLIIITMLNVGATAMGSDQGQCATKLSAANYEMVSQEAQLRNQENIDELKSVVELTPEQEKDLLKARSILRYDEFLDKEAEFDNHEDSFLLGPQGGDYLALKSQSGITSFWDAFYEVGMSPEAVQTPEYVTKFLRKLILEGDRRVFYLMPSNLMVPTKSVREFEIIASDSNMISRVEFVFGPRDFYMDIVED